MIGKYFLYQHIKKDTGEVFYVGIGDKYRPNEKSFRNKFWNNLTAKHEYEVDIVKGFDTWSDACDWEKFFIAIYGKRVCGEGSLVNLTDGGDGTAGFKQSAETIEKKRESFRSKHSYGIDAYMINDRSYIRSYESIESAAFDLNINRGAVHACVHKNQYHTKGYTFCHYGETPEWDQIDHSIATGKSIRGMEKFLKKFSKPVLQYSLSDEFIKEHPSAAAAARELGKYPNAISLCANNKEGFNSAYGFKWKRKQ